MPKKLKKLEPKHHTAVRLKVEGKTNGQIAIEIGVRKSTVNGWFTDPLLKDAVEDMQKRVGEIFADKLASSGLQTLDVMKQMLEMPLGGGIGEDGKPKEQEYLSFDQRMQIIDRFLDRNPHTNPPGRGDGGEDGNGSALPPGIQAQLNILSGMNPGELMELLGSIVSGHAPPKPKAIETKT